MKNYIPYFALLALLACSENQTAGITTTGGGDEENDIVSQIVLTGDFDSTSTAYLYDSPYTVVDSTKGQGKISFTPKDSKNYRVAVLGSDKGALSQEVSLGDSIAVKTKIYIKQDLELVSLEEVVSVQAAYSPVVQGKEGSFKLQLLEDTSELKLTTAKESYTYDLAVKEEKATLTPKGEALELKVSATLLDESIWQSRYIFSDWNGDINALPSYKKLVSAILSDTLTTKEENGKTVLDFSKDAFLSAPLSLNDTAFSMMIAFKTDQANTGLFQFATKEKDHENSSTDWQGYIEGGKLKIQINSGSAEVIEIDSKFYQTGALSYLLFQIDKKDGLQIWVNGKTALNKPTVKSINSNPTHFHFGFSDRASLSPLISKGFYQGFLQELTVFSRNLKDSEIQILRTW